MDPVDPSLPLNLIIFPSKLSPLGIIAQEGKRLEWIHLHHKGHSMLTAYPTLLAQLVNQERTPCQLLIWV